MTTEHRTNMDELSSWESQIRQLSDIILANVVMFSELPAPTFKEDKRRDFLLQRFAESELINVSYDEKGNALGILPGTSGDRNILLVSHLDSNIPEEVDHTVTVRPESIAGRGVSDNAMGLASIASLPQILKHLGINLKANIILMGSTKSLGKGNLEGLRFFLDNKTLAIDFGLVVEGVKLGRLSHASIGMLRGEISYLIPEEYDWTKFESGGATIGITEVINKILAIPLPSRPKTSINIGSVKAGTTHDKRANKALLQFEIRSESEEQVHELAATIDMIAAEQASKTGADVQFQIIASRRPGGIAFSNPIVTHARTILRSLGISPRFTPSINELAAFIDNKIPALTLGITDGENLTEEMEEKVYINPIYKGLTQIIGMLTAMDQEI
ncbi:M20/M25/M40 family metallo-hydrolase [Spirochaeta cellobiosiphila]|uniref:M20/M25/M40 family metallo-hydrolase n=1 Tax=Spirochaeta cellobiosiphila TaxID=504483 RepID=UPI000413C2D0|nr:M20/M25/M40 family metallo-hydrolase [Spirochaeta cellobiosiphila]